MRCPPSLLAMPKGKDYFGEKVLTNVIYFAPNVKLLPKVFQYVKKGRFLFDLLVNPMIVLSILTIKIG